jgi:SM-20-related protein
MADAEFLRRLGLFVEPNFLDPQLCEEYRSEMKRVGGKPATVSAHAEDEVDENHRRTRQADMSEATTAALQARLEAVKPAIEKHFGRSLSEVQKPQFLTYRTGDFFRPHSDNSDEEDAAEGVKRRQVSVVSFLNDESAEPAQGCYGGGHLTFYGLLGDESDDSPIGIPIEGKAGQLVAFPSEMLHGVGAVTHGERYTIVSWFV